MQALSTSGLTRGNLFCEWGSGFGVVACLAAMLDFDAWGIEIEGELVEAARSLAGDFGLPVEFIHGSFIPAGSAACLSAEDGFAWLDTHEHHRREDAELGPDDFDVIFAYPWPDEEHTIENLFDRHAAVGAVLVTYHEAGDLRVRRKAAKRTSSR